MLDEPSDSTTPDTTPTPDGTAPQSDAPAKKAPRKRATRKAAAPAPEAPAGSPTGTPADTPQADTAQPDTPQGSTTSPAVDAAADSSADSSADSAAPQDAAPPAKKAPRKRATRKAAAAPAAPPAEVPTAEVAAPDSAAGVPDADATAPEAATAEAAAPEAAAPAKKAPRKRATRKAAAPPAEEAPAGTEPLATATDGLPAIEAPQAATTEADLVAAVLLDADEPVVEAVEDDPAVAEAVADDTSTAALATEGTPVSRSRRGRGRRASAPAAAPAAAEPSSDADQTAGSSDTTPSAVDPAQDAPEDAPAPRARRRRAPAVVTFVAPDEVPPASASRTASTRTATPDAAAEPADDAPAPRRRRRAGTSGAVSPDALLTAPDATSDTAPVTGPEAGTDDDEDDDRPRRRRRGRRGRGPRRDDETTEATEDDDPTAATAEGDDAEDDDESDEGEESSEGGTRRRRRRRRRGGSGSDDSDDSSDDVPTVVHVREPREKRVRGASAADEDGVRGITGSTRMAAKRVRRQEGRDSGRRRTPVLTEAEFLARREAVERQMVVRQKGDMTQIAVLEDGILVEHYVTKASAQSYAGNVYLGRVQNVLPSMEAAFVDIGKGRNGVLYAGEVNFEGSGTKKIEQVLKSGQEVLVQVSKDPIGHKGARLTSQVSLPGRYLVYVPEGSMTGISRKLPEQERSRLKSILKKVVPDDAGVIIRTAAEGASQEEIEADVRRLQAQWEVIQEKAGKGGGPKLLQAEPDLVVKVVRDVFNEDFTSLLVQGDSEWDTIRDYVEFVAPDLLPRLKRHTSEKDVFSENRIDEQLLKALDRKVHLPSGGSLVIDRTEAMVVIDVNTGKYVGKGGNLEETVTRNNLEAAEEIARQLRLRDLGGIIVVDFIDMVLESNRDLVVRRLVECLGRDRTKHQVAEVTSLGLVQMTRKRVGQGLLESFSETCDSCGGRGVHVRTDVAGNAVGSRQTDGGAGIERVAAAAAKAAPKKESDAPAAETASDDAPSEDAPKRRRRGGRGRGSATVAPQDEMSELLAEPAGSEIPPAPAADEQPAVLTPDSGSDADSDGGTDTEPGTDPEVDVVADAPATVAADPAAGSAPVAPQVDAPQVDAVPDVAEQPTAAQEDLPVVPDVVQSVVEPEPVDPRPDLVEFGNEPEVEPRPRRRRRATSRPAGAPEQ